MSGLHTWPGRPAGLSLHLGQDLGSRPVAPAWLPHPRRVERVRIGSSLCPRLLPPLDRLRHAAKSARSWTARLELETPVLGDADLYGVRQVEFTTSADGIQDLGLFETGQDFVNNVSALGVQK